MARVLGRLWVPLAAGLATACNPSLENPFSDVLRTHEPSGGCAVAFSSDLHADQPGGLSEIHCVGLDGAPPERLTYGAVAAPECALVEFAPAPDRLRGVVRRVVLETDGDGQLTEADGAALCFLDLSRGVLSELVEAREGVSGVDWAPVAEEIVYAALAPGGREDLFRRTLATGEASANLTDTPLRSERRPRFDAAGNLALFEMQDPGGRSTIWSMYSAAQLSQLTRGAPGATPLPGSPYAVGDDADPAGSPDGSWVAFRRLVAIREDGGGVWEILRVASDGSGEPEPLVSGGAVARGAPDWSERGIVFTETDLDSRITSLVLVDGQGGEKRVLTVAPPGFRLAHPRWL